MTKINEIWNLLEEDTSVGVGIGLRRYSSTISPNVFVGVCGPDKKRCIAIALDKSIAFDLEAFNAFEELKLDMLSDVLSGNKNLLVLKLLHSQHSDVFSILCEDLLHYISNVSGEEMLVKAIVERVEKWSVLFDTMSSQGLTSERQIGLYGELFLLRNLLEKNSESLKVVRSWVGPESENKDFQYGRWAVEVKATVRNNHQKIQISNERQLDDAMVDSLLLYHLSLEKQINAGETLNDIVDSIRVLLASHVSSLREFEQKLLLGGFLERDMQSYSNVGYLIRREVFYSVNGQFPRIVEADVKNGVGEVKYTVILSSCQSYIISFDQVSGIINYL